MAKQFTVDDIQEVTLPRKMMAVEAVWCSILFKGCTTPVKFYATERYAPDNAAAVRPTGESSQISTSFGDTFAR